MVVVEQNDEQTHVRTLRTVLELHALFTADRMSLSTVPQVALTLSCSEARAGRLLAEGQSLVELPVQIYVGRWQMAPRPGRDQRRIADLMAPPGAPRHALPAGLLESDPLPAPWFSPATKAETGHDENITFEEMGVDALFLDEAHVGKNLYFTTKIKNMGGKGSERATDLYLKTRHLHTVNPTHGVIFATGTPISNSVSEIWTMMRYLDPEGLAAAGLSHFDYFAQTFGIIAMTNSAYYLAFTFAVERRKFLFGRIHPRIWRASQRPHARAFGEVVRGHAGHARFALGVAAQRETVGVDGRLRGRIRPLCGRRAPRRRHRQRDHQCHGADRDPRWTQLCCLHPALLCSGEPDCNHAKTHAKRTGRTVTRLPESRPAPSPIRRQQHSPARTAAARRGTGCAGTAVHKAPEPR